MMDLTPKYIKMCEKAEEMQEHHTMVIDETHNSFR